MMADECRSKSENGSGSMTKTGDEPAKNVRSGLDGRPDCFKKTSQEVAWTVATATNSFFAGASNLVTAAIGKDLGMSQGQMTWIAAGMSLTAGAFQLGLGQLADLLGRRIVFIGGLFAFAGFVLLLSFAQTPYWMDVVSGVLGVCSAMVVPPAIGIMGAAYDRPSKRKNLAFSAFSAGNPLGAVFGNIVCGVAVKLSNWRAAYRFMAMLWFVFAVLATVTVPRVEAFPPAESLKSRMRKFVATFDAVGTLLTIFGVGLLTASVTLGPYDSWNSGHVIAMMVVGVALLVAFVFWETRFPTPLMPPSIWSDRNFSLIMVTCVCGYMSFVAAQFWMTLFMQELQGLSTLAIAVRILPQAIAGLIWNFIAGSSLHRVNNTFLLVLSTVSYTVSNILLALMKPDSSYWAFIFPSLILSVVGADFQFNVSNMYVMQSLPANQQGLAGGIYQTLFRLTSAMSLSLTTAVYISVAKSDATDPVIPYIKVFWTCVGLSAGGALFVPFIRLATQGMPDQRPVLNQSVENAADVRLALRAPVSTPKAASRAELEKDAAILPPKRA